MLKVLMGGGGGGRAAETRIRMVPAESEWPTSMLHPMTDLQEVQPYKVSLPQARKSKALEPSPRGSLRVSKSTRDQ